MAEDVRKNASAETSIANVNADVLQDPGSGIWTVGMLDRALSDLYPAQTAYSWDRQGLIAGNPADVVGGVAVALDATVEAVHVAAQSGANVLLTHHPVFLEAPDSFLPAALGQPQSSGVVVYEAVRQGVSLINYHTSLDVSKAAQAVLPSMLSLEFEQVVDPIEPGSALGIGQLCAPNDQDAPLTLKALAARCVAVFGRIPRVWGSMDTTLSRIVTCTGSAGDLADICLARKADCLVCGEVRYHTALPASKAGMCIIELGHDVSELPLAAVLAQSVESLGFSAARIKVIAQSQNWTTPEAIRR